jgi:hypothetical protein
LTDPRPTPRDPLAALDAIDARIDWGIRLTLSPSADKPTSLRTLAETLTPGPLQRPFAAAIERVAEAQLHAFPGNLFWDMDALASSLVRQARAHEQPAQHLARLAGHVARLQRLFGAETAIHFRYVHDFIYGYDWAKWVKRDPEGRASVGPFDEVFLIYSERRAGELMALIAEDDAKYHRLPEGKARNPFGFSREPEDELRLFRDLAERELLPIRAWELDPPLDWEPPYLALREERAEALGLTCRR